MTRRPTDSPNWGGPREHSKSRALFDEPCDVLRSTLPKRLITKLRKKAKATGLHASVLLARMLNRMT